MPCVDALLDESPVRIVFPSRSEDGTEWLWPELEVVRSSIEGFGLATRSGGAIDWAADAAQCPIFIPILGRETELGNDEDEVAVFTHILHGYFVPFTVPELRTPTAGMAWRTNGVFVEEVPLDAVPLGWGEVDRKEIILQVFLDEVTSPDAPDSSCVYVLEQAAIRLLHIPPPIFAVLEQHHEQHHNDRHFATHVISFRSAPDVQTLVNAHPVFSDTAYVAGCVNEPAAPGGDANLELVTAQLSVLLGQVDAATAKEWANFAAEFPEVLDRHIFFMTSNDSYDASGEELVAHYGGAYHRRYPAASSFQPHDLLAARWPHRVPAWWNPSMQPVDRPALCLIEDDESMATTVVDDDPALVQARRAQLVAAAEAAAQPGTTPVASIARAAKDKAAGAWDALEHEVSCSRPQAEIPMDIEMEWDVGNKSDEDVATGAF